MNSKKRVLVIGGGFVGLAIAFRLQMRGFCVNLLDDAKSDIQPSLGNAGHIAIEQNEPLASWQSVASISKRHFIRGGPVDFPLSSIAHWGPFGARLLWAGRHSQFCRSKAVLTSLLSKAMPAWERLVAEIDAKELLVQNGHYLLSETKAAAAANEKKWLIRENPSVTAKRAPQSDIDKFAHLLRIGISNAVYFENTGHIRDLFSLRMKLLDQFQQSGGTLQTQPVSKLRLDGTRAAALTKDGAEVEADFTIVAAGAGSAPLMQSFGHKVPLIHERGYHIEAPVSLWPKEMPILVLEERGVLLTAFDHGFRMSGFVEFTKPDAAPDHRKWNRLEKYADEFGISFDEKPRRWIGSRPTLPDYMPAIGRSQKADNLLYAFGHNHLGLTLSPITAEIICDLMVGSCSTYANELISIERFR